MSDLPEVNPSKLPFYERPTILTRRTLKLVLLLVVLFTIVGYGFHRYSVVNTRNQAIQLLVSPKPESAEWDRDRGLDMLVELGTDAKPALPYVISLLAVDRNARFVPSDREKKIVAIFANLKDKLDDSTVIQMISLVFHSRQDWDAIKCLDAGQPDWRDHPFTHSELGIRLSNLVEEKELNLALEVIQSDQNRVTDVWNKTKFHLSQNSIGVLFKKLGQVWSPSEKEREVIAHILTLAIPDWKTNPKYLKMGIDDFTPEQFVKYFAKKESLEYIHNELKQRTPTSYLHRDDWQQMRDICQKFDAPLSKEIQIQQQLYVYNAVSNFRKSNPDTCDFAPAAMQELERIDPNWAKNSDAKYAIPMLVENLTFRYRPYNQLEEFTAEKTKTLKLLNEIDPKWMEHYDLKNTLRLIGIWLHRHHYDSANEFYPDDVMIEVIGEMGTHARSIIPALLRYNYRVRLYRRDPLDKNFDPSNPKPVQTLTLQTLEKIDPKWRESPEALTLIKNLIEDLGGEIPHAVDSYPNKYRKAIIALLGEFGPLAKPAIPALEKLKKENEYYKREIDATLVKINGEMKKDSP